MWAGVEARWGGTGGGGYEKEGQYESKARKRKGGQADRRNKVFLPLYHYKRW